MPACCKLPATLMRAHPAGLTNMCASGCLKRVLRGGPLMVVHVCALPGMLGLRPLEAGTCLCYTLCDTMAHVCVGPGSRLCDTLARVCVTACSRLCDSLAHACVTACSRLCDSLLTPV